MEGCHAPSSVDASEFPVQKIIRHSTSQPKLSSWLDLRVFYVRFSNCKVDQSTPEYLTLNHIPLRPNTLSEVNGRRSRIYSEAVSLVLRRDKVDKKSEEATFVSTERVRVRGSVKFEVYHRDHLLISGSLELRSGSGRFTEDSRSHSKRWSMTCQSTVTAYTCFSRGKQYTGLEWHMQAVDVCVAGSFLDTPVILGKTLQLSFWRKPNRKGMLDSIPEYETTESKSGKESELALQLSKFKDYKEETNHEDYNNLYSRAEFIESDDDELSWFNTGVKVGVGIGIGICLGIGIGAGLLVRTYQATTRSFKRRLG
ncbi:hypothetical protein MRB53_029643 [Persea americana]|uniref:Uncharacterized protein n=1 Tax=Persea americana TaxID=3435 RepID=A0ACC2KJ03_PERAE|nr:hypothetical protein MRB53_029643 [Persea americana]